MKVAAAVLSSQLKQLWMSTWDKYGLAPARSVTECLCTPAPRSSTSMRATSSGAIMAATASSGMNCIKIGLPGKSILGDYFQENKTFQRPFLLLRISFPGRPIFKQLPSGPRRPWTSTTRTSTTCRPTIPVSITKSTTSSACSWYTRCSRCSSWCTSSCSTTTATTTTRSRRRSSTATSWARPAGSPWTPPCAAAALTHRYF